MHEYVGLLMPMVSQAYGRHACMNLERCVCVFCISDEQTKLRKKNEELRKINAYLECENEEYAGVMMSMLCMLPFLSLW